MAAFARDWRQREREAAHRAGRGTYVPLQFAPGEAFQFDWSEDWVRIGARPVKVQVAHFKLCHSRAFMLRAYPQQTHEMLFDAHNHCLAALGGVPERGIYDNMKTAVDRLVGASNARSIPASGPWSVTSSLKPTSATPQPAGKRARWRRTYAMPGIASGRTNRRFNNLAALNEWLEARCQTLWQEIAHPEQPACSVADVWADERAVLMAMPPPFDGFVEHTKRVSPTCLIVFERNRYSVPAAFANRAVSLRVYAERLVIVAEAQIVAEHARVFSRDHNQPGRTVYDWRHYLAVVQRKPGALRNGAPFNELPRSFRALQAVLLKRPGGDREMAEILALVLHHDEHGGTCCP